MLRFHRQLFLMAMVCLIFGGTHILCPPQASFAQSSGAEEVLAEEITKIDSEAGKDVERVEEALTGQFGVQKQDIQSLLDEKVSHGNIAAMLAVSASSGKPRQDVLGMVKSGKKWAEIADATGTPLESILTQVQEVSKKVSGEATAKPKRKMKFAPGT